MKPLFAIALLLIALLSCIKKDYPPECVPITFTELQTNNFVGKWRWYNTRVTEWFDFGPDSYHYYTPQNQGFDYYFIITEDGRYKGYRNDSLVHDHILNKTTYQNIDQDTIKSITFSIDCTVLSLGFSRHPALSFDTLNTTSYPINFIDDENHLVSNYNSFVRE